MIKRLSSICCCLLLGIFFYIGCSRSQVDFDILITKGNLVDGTGSQVFYGDIGIQGDTITEIGNLSGKTASKTIDATGLIVSPGFIDMHTHCRSGLDNAESSANLNYLTQGVTTVQVGPDGSGTYKIADTKIKWEEQGIGTNVFLLVGHGTVRREAMGTEVRAPTEEELNKMKSLIRQAMEEGAWGMSVGLQYIPGRNAETEEVIELAKVVSGFDGIFHTHQRSEEKYFVEATQETIRIGKESGASVDLTHIKAGGKSNWGKMKEAVRLINEARSEGFPIYADMYPYDKAAVGHIMQNFNIPEEIEAELQKQGESRDLYIEALAKALSDPVKREKIKELTAKGAPNMSNYVVLYGWDSFSLVSAIKNNHLIDKILTDIAEELKKDPFDVAADLLIEEKGGAFTSVDTMSEDDIKHVMKQDWLMFCSDGSTFIADETSKVQPSSGHPRSYGSFPRVFRKYVRKEMVLTLEEAIRKMTSLPASFLQMKDRGILRKGYKADVVIFDPDTMKDHATYTNIHQHSTGVEYVIINGKLSIEEGKYNDMLNGQVLLTIDSKAGP